MKIKRISILTIIASILISVCSVCCAENDISVRLNNEQLEFDIPPQLIGDRTMVPMRAIFEALGCDVKWIDEHSLIIAMNGEKIIAMMIGKANMPIQNIVTGEEKTAVLDSPPVIVNDRTLVPVRAVSEALGAEVDWIEETNTVVITTGQAEAAE